MNRIRKPKIIPLKKAVVNTALLLIAGLMTGFVIKLLDIYTVYLGDIFSRLPVWAFICAVISVYSASPLRASMNVFLYCAGMLLTYYLTAELLNSSYSMTFAYGWAVFSVFTPLLAFFAWYTKGKGVFLKLVALVALVLMLFAVWLFFSAIISDVVFTFAAFLIMLLPEKDKSGS